MAQLKTNILLHHNTNIPFLILFDTNQKEMLLAWNQYAHTNSSWESEKYRWVYCQNQARMLFIILTKNSANLKTKKNEML